MHLSDHLASRHQLRIQAMQDVLQVLSLSGLLGVEQLKELLDERVGDEHLQGLDIGSLVHDQLKEELVHRLQMRPGGIHELLPLDSIFTSSSSPPISPLAVYFFRIGSGLKMFFSIISMIKSRCGTTRFITKFCSFSSSNNSCKY